MTDSAPAGLGWLRLLALSVACSLTVSVIYIPQSLLTSIAGDLGVSHGLASVLAAITQVGYAVGILLLVPLAARLEVRKQVTYQTLALTCTLLLAAVVPNVFAAIAAFLAVGLVANVSQVLIPAANRMSADDRRGKTNSVLVGALLVGIFGGRVVASLCTEWIGWRGTVVVSALAVAASIPSTRWALRKAPLPEGGVLTHSRLVLATLRRASSNPILVRSALTQACVLATFNALWTVMVLHLTGPELSWTLGEAGLFGLVGLVAGFFTPYAGRLIDRHGARRMTGCFLLVLLTAMMAILLTSNTPVAFGAVMFVATWANQSALSGNQVRALATDPERSAQLNTVFSFIVFLGGGIGGLLGPLMYAWHGIDAVATVGVVLVLVAIAQWSLIPRAAVDRSQLPSVEGRLRTTLIRN
ncbi:MFS transporter [Mycolicibacterium mengxianglii]|uniref:MFS transporter n=1 Tax=Mycolicibacterium mengxianglii TaxID=2736649 RepID=UPI0018D0018F|nr:MFS transporter [Mycolicibacterium mengxianglii]